MPTRLPSRDEKLTNPDGSLILSDRVSAFKRIYRWFNLTLFHQAIWPLALVLTSAPALRPELLPFKWYLVRLVGPVLAALAAFLILRQPVPNRPGPAGPVAPSGVPESELRTALRTQVRFILLGLPLMVLAARLISGPTAGIAQLALFGAVDVAAYHLIHFGVVRRSYAEADRGETVAVFLFGLSWALQSVTLTMLSPGEGSWWLAFVGGAVAGWLVAFGARSLRQWPGGWLPAMATHWLVIYLILQFVN